jgi:hypothetical protein
LGEVRLLSVILALSLAVPGSCGTPDLFVPGAVKLSLRDAPAGVVIGSIAASAGLDLVLPPLPGVTLTVHLRSASVAEAFEAIADVTGLTLEVRGRMLVVFAPGRAPAPEADRLRFERPRAPALAAE